MARKSTNKPVVIEPSDADVWASKAASKVADAMAAWLKGSLNLSRPIASLTRDEMERLATAAIGTWIVLASERLHGNAPNETAREKLRAILS